MNSFIFNPKQSAIKEKTKTCYGIKTGTSQDEHNYSIVSCDSPDCLAQQIDIPDYSTQYYIKISNNNKLFNPLDAGLEDKSYSITDNVCKPSDKFRSVNKKVFDIYLQFLSTKNIAWLNIAEREMI